MQPGYGLNAAEINFLENFVRKRLKRKKFSRKFLPDVKQQHYKGYANKD